MTGSMGGVSTSEQGAFKPRELSRLASRTAVLAVFLHLVSQQVSSAGPLEDGEMARNDKNYEAALRLLTPLAEQGNPEAQLQLGLMYSNGEGIARDRQRADELFRSAAEQGNSEAQRRVGLKYELSQNYSQAMIWYRKAADQGNACAKFNIGVAYDLGDGVPKSRSEALKWIRMAADLGCPAAENDISYRYQTGTLGLPKDLAKAADWERRCADQGVHGCQYTLGLWYAKGRGVPQDYGKAFDLFSEVEKSPFKEDVSQAKSQIATLYANGWGVPQNYQKAAEYWTMAMGKGADEIPALGLGNLYYEGKGVTQDYNLAKEYWEKAAGILSSDGSSARFIAQLYIDGNGVPQNRMEAYKWLEIASAKGDRQSLVDRDRLKVSMTKAELAQALSSADEWGKVHFGRNWRRDFILFQKIRSEDN